MTFMASFPPYPTVATLGGGGGGDCGNNAKCDNQVPSCSSITTSTAIAIATTRIIQTAPATTITSSLHYY
jgi:hypothetical protein